MEHIFRGETQAMQASTPWADDPTFIEFGARDTHVCRALRHAGHYKYLGVLQDEQRLAELQAAHPEVAELLTFARWRKLVLNNNADVLVLTGSQAAKVWSYRSVRHAKFVAWRLSFSPFTLLATLGCVWHLLTKRYSRPRLVSLTTPDGKRVRLLSTEVLRRKRCRRDSLHFIPHAWGLRGAFQEFERQGIEYVVLRWFDRLPNIKPGDDVDVLVADDSTEKLIDLLQSLPGIQPCDLYSESGLSRSAYCGTPYYPRHVARRLLEGAVLHNNLCRVPNDWDYFHSLAYHAVYHKGPKSNLSRGNLQFSERVKSEHDFTGLLGAMSRRLGISSVEISLPGLHLYLQSSGWAPSQEMLARLAVACWRNEWLRVLASRVDRHVRDQGLAVFVIREEAVARGFQDEIVRMISEQGFEVLAVRPLAPHEVAPAAARTRGGNWIEEGPFENAGGLPAVTVVAYDRHPIPPNRQQLKRFKHRTNARLFAKETIRDAIVDKVPKGESFNAVHSSDHAAEAWHLIEELAPDILEQVRERLQEIYAEETRLAPAKALQLAA